MIIKIDIREQELISEIKNMILFVPTFKKLNLVTETLPLGDIIIADEKEEKLVIERKTINDLLSSIKDGRYEEQSYRLNGLDHHNHNIIYLLEGDVNKINRFKDNQIEKLTAYSAMFSINYYKGFSIFRTLNINETSLVICNMAYKLEKGTQNDKKPFYQNKHVKTIKHDLPKEPENVVTETICNEDQIHENENEEVPEQSEKDYINVIKKVKKDNITPNNICEIMLCQIPGVSTITAKAIMEKYNNLPNLIKELEINEEGLKNITYTNTKGQIRKINKTSIINIAKFLLKK